MSLSVRKLFDALRAFEQTEIIERNGRKIIIKKYGGLQGALKWNLLYLPPISLYYPTTNDPLERMIREEKFFTNPPSSIVTPRVYSLDYKNIVMEREVIDGREVSANNNDLFLLGKNLRKIHKANYRMGDPRLQNFVVTPQNKIGVIDAEQSIVSENDLYKAWDILILILFVYIDLALKPLNVFEENIKAFFANYCEEKNIITWKSLEEIKLHIILLPPPFRRVVKKALSLLCS